MGKVLNYKSQLIKAMEMLAQNQKAIFIGQGIIHPDVTSIFDTLKTIPIEQRLELPVFEDTQMGISIGLSLAGFLPISIYSRMDFLIIAMNQLVNHLDKFYELSNRQFNPRVIVRTSVGATYPLNPGSQHCQNHSKMLRKGLTNIDVIELEEAEQIIPAYQNAINSNKSTILVEFARKLQ